MNSSDQTYYSASQGGAEGRRERRFCVTGDLVRRRSTNENQGEKKAAKTKKARGREDRAIPPICAGHEGIIAAQELRLALLRFLGFLRRRVPTDCGGRQASLQVA